MADKKKKKAKINYLPDKAIILELVNRQVTEHPVVKVHHGKWKELIAWTDRGQQFSEWDDDGYDMKPVKLRRRKKRIVINMMKPLAEAIEGRLNMNYQIAGMPNSGEREDVESSKIATRLLAHNDYINSRDALNEDMKYDLVRTGNCVEKIVWDMGHNGYIEGSDGKSPQKQEGEVIASVPSIFNVRPDPTAKHRKNMRWLVEIDEMTKEAILGRWKKIKKEDLEKVATSGNAVADKHKGMNEPIKEIDAKEETYIVKYYWERKSKQWSKGRLIIFVEDLEAWSGQNPALGEIPFFFDGYKRNGNSFWYTGPMYHYQPIQREINRNESIISEHSEGWRAKMIVPKGAIIKEGAFTKDSFELLEVDESKGKLYPLNTPELSQQELGRTDQMIGYGNQVSNVHEVSYSQLPKYASRAPASLYSMMLEKEGEKENPLIKRMNDNILEKAKFRIRLMQKYYTQPRLTKTVGRESEIAVDYFKGVDLKGNLDVKLIFGISLHQSRVVQQRLLLELKAQGAPITWNKIIKILESGAISEELRSDIKDEMRADRENYAFQNGTYKKSFKEGGFLEIELEDRVTGKMITHKYAPYIHDDHVIHLERHTDFAKSEEAQKWGKETWNDFQDHANLHFALILKLKAMEQQEAARPGARSPASEVIGGGTPGPGETPTSETKIERETIS